MKDFAFDQVRHGRKTDVRVRTDIQTLTAAEHRLAHLVEEDERADHPALRAWQCTTDPETVTQVAHRRQDDLLDAFDIEFRAE